MNGAVIFTLIFLYLILSCVLAIVPANIAKAKGYQYNIWWVYGFFVLPLAIIHIACLPNKIALNAVLDALTHDRRPSAAEEIEKYKELYEQGVISEEEFEEKKKQLLTML